MAAVLNSVTIPDDGKPVLQFTVTERHGSGVKNFSPAALAAVTWRFALPKLNPSTMININFFISNSIVCRVRRNQPTRIRALREN